MHYREISLSPPGHPGIPYSSIIAGVLAGLRGVYADAGIDSRMIIGLDRNDIAASAYEPVQQVVEHRIDKVIAIALDYSQAIGPPEKFWERFDSRAEPASTARPTRSRGRRTTSKLFSICSGVFESTTATT